ncbi:hypothetical protein AGLY_001602 [Aphis glycines]|uniref:Uncharacterized protein n=1 Tax=Aphis glycines TaxID=307491 RepID=A0A6G0U655_APHGL|nr:hypothetical protein AGLY_001602 [Aphis glycines]
MEDNTKQISNSIASGRSDSTEVTEKDSKPDVQIKKPELLPLKCRNLEKMYSDTIENDSEVQASASTVDIKIKEPKVKEAKQIISDVSPDNYTREHVQLSDLKVYLNVPINRIGAFMTSTNMSSDENNIENINVPPILEDLKNAEGQESLCIPVDMSDIDTGEYDDSVPINEIGVFMSPTEVESDENNIENINVPSISDDLKNAGGQESLCLPVDVSDVDTGEYDDSVLINEIGAFMSPTDVESDENNIENINVPSISDNLKNAESLCMPVDVLDIETIIHNDSVGSDVIELEKSTARQPRPKRRFLSALVRGLLKVSRSLCCWRCK